jgi:hypothetical protein
MIEVAKNKQFFTKIYSDEIFNKYIIRKNTANKVTNKLSEKLVEKFTNSSIPSAMKNELQNSLRLGMNSSDLILQKKNNQNQDSEVSAMSKSLSPTTIKDQVSKFVQNAVSKAVNSMNYKDANKNKMEISGSTVKKNPNELKGSEIPTPRISPKQSQRLSTEKVPQPKKVVKKTNQSPKRKDRSPKSKSPNSTPSPKSIPSPKKNKSDKKTIADTLSERQLRSEKEQNAKLRSIIKNLEKRVSKKVVHSDVQTEKHLRNQRKENEKLRSTIKKLERKIGSISSYNPVAADTDSSDLAYNDYTDKGLLPLGAGLQSWKNDYVLLNTDKWRPAINPIPHCKVEKECPVCPNMSAGYAKSYSTLKDFNKSRKVMPPDNINVDYINKLNAGR